MANDQSPLNVPVQQRELPGDVAEARRARAADDARNETIAQPRIEAALTACKLALGELERLHRQIADQTDLDLTGYSRPSAVWLLAGRVLGLLRALLVQVEAGICNEAVVTGRSIHEGNRVLFAFGLQGSDALVHKWLDDEGRHGYVKQPEARDIEEEFERELEEVMKGAGLPPLPRTREKTEELYDQQSRFAHNRRSTIVDQVWVPGREMAYGVHPSPIRRATYASWAAEMTIEVINAAGDAIAAFFSRGFFDKEIVPFRDSIEAVRSTVDLDPASIRRDAGTAG